MENHSHTHPHHFACLGIGALRRQVADAQAILADATGLAPSWFRAPMGFRSPLLDPVLHGAGLQLASWTRRGYDTRCRVPATVLSRLVSRLAAGDVLLLHDGNGARTASGRPVVLEVLPSLLARLRGNRTQRRAARHASSGSRGSRPSTSRMCIQVSSTLSRP